MRYQAELATVGTQRQVSGAAQDVAGDQGGVQSERGVRAGEGGSVPDAATVGGAGGCPHSAGVVAEPEGRSSSRGRPGHGQIHGGNTERQTRGRRRALWAAEVFIARRAGPRGPGRPGAAGVAPGRHPSTAGPRPRPAPPAHARSAPGRGRFPRPRCAGVHRLGTAHQVLPCHPGRVGALGGVIGREVAPAAPRGRAPRDHLQHRNRGWAQVHRRRARLRSARERRCRPVAERLDVELHIQMPLTVVFTVGRIVSWEACIDGFSPYAEHGRSSTHIGMELDPDVWRVIADWFVSLRSHRCCVWSCA